MATRASVHTSARAGCAAGSRVRRAGFVVSSPSRTAAFNPPATWRAPCAPTSGRSRSRRPCGAQRSGRTLPAPPPGSPHRGGAGPASAAGTTADEPRSRAGSPGATADSTAPKSVNHRSTVHAVAAPCPAARAASSSRARRAASRVRYPPRRTRTGGPTPNAPGTVTAIHHDPCPGSASSGHKAPTLRPVPRARHPHRCHTLPRLRRPPGSATAVDKVRGRVVMSDRRRRPRRHRHDDRPTPVRRSPHSWPVIAAALGCSPPYAAAGCVSPGGECAGDEAASVGDQADHRAVLRPGGTRSQGADERQRSALRRGCRVR